MKNNNEFFPILLERYVSYANLRQTAIKEASDLLRVSKQAIFALHRGDNSLADKYLAIGADLIEKFKKRSELLEEGSFLAGLEEYLEASLLYSFLKNGKLELLSNVPDSFYESYLGAICDFTGEIVRKALSLAGTNEWSRVEDLKQVVENVLENLSKFDLVGHLRTKYDEARRNLKRMEEIVYDFKVKIVK